MTAAEATTLNTTLQTAAASNSSLAAVVSDFATNAESAGLAINKTAITTYAQPALTAVATVVSPTPAPTTCVAYGCFFEGRSGAGCRPAGQTLDGSFSFVSTPIFASKH